ncbi:MAG: dipeptidase PepV [Synergistaceae bacterium]|jgi:succinyl-diaminopimelate desuccinylase|nr:dipeptidase PepV [Synergistaceae bacterium]
MEKIHSLIGSDFDALVDDLSALLKIRSVLDESHMTDEHPFGPGVTAALEKFLAIASRLGFRTKNIDNMAGYAEAGEGPLFGVLAHLDVVPEGKAGMWKFPPFGAVVSDGKLYGRGTNDDKGPAMSALYALKALRDSGTALNRRFRVIVGLDEESGFRCIERYKKTEEIPEEGFSPDANFPVVNGEKGSLSFALSKRISASGIKSIKSLPEVIAINGGTRLNVVPDEARILFRGASAGHLEKVFLPDASVRNEGAGVQVVVNGAAAHAMEPWKGDNAIYKFLARLDELDFGPPALHAELFKLRGLFNGETDGKSLGVACRDDISGPLSCNLAVISFDGENLAVKCDIRYPVKADGKFVLDGIARAADSIGWTPEVLKSKTPLYVAPDSNLVRTLLDAYEAVTGERGEPFSIGGGTYCRAMPNSVSFGGVFPGEEENAHQANEYIALDSLRRMTHIYAEALARFNRNAGQQ